MLANLTGAATGGPSATSGLLSELGLDGSSTGTNLVSSLLGGASTITAATSEISAAASASTPAQIVAALASAYQTQQRNFFNLLM